MIITMDETVITEAGQVNSVEVYTWKHAESFVHLFQKIPDFDTVTEAACDTAGCCWNAAFI